MEYVVGIFRFVLHFPYDSKALCNQHYSAWITIRNAFYLFTFHFSIQFHLGIHLALDSVYRFQNHKCQNCWHCHQKKQQKEFRSQYVWRSARSTARFLEYFKHILNISMAIHTRTCFCVFHAADVLVKIVQCAAHLSIDVRMAISITT